MRKLVLVALLLEMTVSCRRKAPKIDPVQFPLPPDTTVSLRRSQCFGACPVYELTVRGDGTVSYFGEMFVRVHGPQKKVIGQDIVRGLVEAFQRAGYFKWKDRYSAEVTDVPSATLAVTLGGVHKTIEHWDPGGFGPYGDDEIRARLVELEDLVDRVAGSDPWVKCPERERGRCVMAP